MRSAKTASCGEPFCGIFGANLALGTNPKLRSNIFVAFKKSKKKRQRVDLYWCDATRMVMLGPRLENLGIDNAIRLGDLELWEQALANQKQQEGNLNTQI